jgi:hypothetical protein
MNFSAVIMGWGHILATLDRDHNNHVIPIALANVKGDD